MRHRKLKNKLNRSPSHREAMLKNLSASLLQYERISTTLPKAKAVRTRVDHLITLAKREDLHARRQALSLLPDKKVAGKLFDQLGARYAERNGGYTRIFKLGYRRGDAAQMAIIELVDAQIAVTEKKDKSK